jgi:SAM-dependent methyltransferase
MDLHDRYLQQASWTRDLRSYLFDRLDWHSAHRLLEVGCGTGAILRDLQTPTPDRSPGVPALFGVDRAATALNDCRLHARRAQLVRADALALPFPDRSFDITCCHFLLLWVNEPIAALREMKRVTVGHVLALAEPDYSRRRDAPSELVELGRLQTEALRRQGADVSIGARLATLFERAGLRIRETGAIKPWNSQPAPASRMRAEWDMLESDLRDIVSSEELDRYRQLDDAARRQGVRQLQVPTYFAWGQV